MDLRNGCRCRCVRHEGRGSVPGGFRKTREFTMFLGSLKARERPFANLDDAG